MPRQHSWKYATARTAQTSVGQMLSFNPAFLNHVGVKKNSQECSQAPSSGLFPESMSLSPFATLAVSSFPIFLTVELVGAVLLYGSLVPSDRGVQVFWNSAVSKAHSRPSSREPKPYHQAICCFCCYALGGRNTALIARGEKISKLPEKDNQAWTGNQQNIKKENNFPSVSLLSTRVIIQHCFTDLSSHFSSQKMIVVCT